MGGEELSGLPRGLRARNARVTTCDLPDPHYILISERVDIYPGEKLIAYDTDVYVLGQKILHIPWFFIDLRQRRSPIVPEAGQNDFEGYYLRLLYQYVMNPENLGGVRLDLTEKLGTGVGVNHFYTIPRGSGEAFAYVRQDGSEYALRVDHTQALPADVMVTLRGDVRQDSLFTFQPTTLTNLNTGVSRVTTHSSTQLTATRALNESTFSTDNTSANLTYNHRVERGTLNYNAAYSRYGTSGFGVTSAADEELWNRVQWMRRLSAGQLNLRIDARTDVDGDAYTGDSFFSGLQRLPEVYLVSEQSDLKWDVLRRIPSRFTVGWGHFDEEPGNTRLDRYLFNWQLQNLNLPLGRRMRLTPTAEVRQTFYGDEDFTALYRYNFTLPLRQEIGPYVVSNLRYSTQQAHGFTPFRFDNVYPYETITESLEFNNNRNLRMNLTGGRDLEYGRWQDAAFRADVEFAPNVTMTQAVAYDLNNKRWRDLVSQYRWANNPLMTFDLSTRYDPQGGQLRNVSTNLQWVVTPKWRLNWLGGYDGIQREVLYNEFLVVRDLHCWDAAVYYSYQRKYVYLYFRLKALNLPLPGFGIGRGGQILDTAQGFPF